MRICRRCVLPETFPGISLNPEGLCHYCAGHDSATDNDALKSKYLRKFQDVLSKTGSKGPYDSIVAYSGGKDSSYTLKILRKDFNLRLLSVTFNHGFHSAQALENIRIITQSLDVDHMVISPNPGSLRHAFRESVSMDYPPRALQRASAMCNTCMHLVKSRVLKFAVEMRIPLIAFGWSPGLVPIQSAVMRLNSGTVRQMQSAMAAALTPIMGRELEPYVLTEAHIQRMDGNGPGVDSTGIHNVYPLAFLEYNEQKMLQELIALGWQSPTDTDANSTNCLLNGFAVQDHIDRPAFILTPSRSRAS